MTEQTQHFDIVIAGGGFVGLSLALALAPFKLKIAVIEPIPFQVREQNEFDARSIGLSLVSKNFYSSLGLWPKLAEFSAPIKTIHVSQQNHYGMVQFNARDIKRDAFGYVVPNHQFIASLYEEIKTKNNIQLFCPHRVESFVNNKTTVIINLDQDIKLAANLLFAADGSRSMIREKLGLKNSVFQHKHFALITNMAVEKNHQQIAFERFTDSGPIAVLPLVKKRCALVLTIHESDVPKIKQLSDDDIIKLIQQRFGYRLGQITKIGQRQCYPLNSAFCEHQVNDRIILLGNAAHTLHPIAAQGLNLGLRDVASIVDIISRLQQDKADLNSHAYWQDYINQRMRDQKRLISFTDSLARLFLYDLLPLSLVRNLGFMSLNIIPGLKNTIARFGMGEKQCLPQMALGIPLQEIVDYATI